VRRSSLIALVLAGLTTLCVVIACTGIAAVGPGSLLGCETGPTPAPTLQDAPKRVASLFPRLFPQLGDVRGVHWQVRDARPRTCPDLAPMSRVYDGLLSLAADPTGYGWRPATPPPIPPGLAELAPSGARWQTSADLDAATGARFWLDPGSHTLYFHVGPLP
jgi:hypothetical protein